MLTPNPHRVLMLVLVLGLLTTLACDIDRSNGAGTGSLPFLNKQRVQKAVDQAFNIALNDKSGSIRVQGGRAVVEGIQEQGNAAQVDVRYVDVYYGSTDMRGDPPGPNQLSRVDRGTAHITHYNDGRWVLTELVVEPFRAIVRTSIEVK